MDRRNAGELCPGESARREAVELHVRVHVRVLWLIDAINCLDLVHVLQSVAMLHKQTDQTRRAIAASVILAGGLIGLCLVALAPLPAGEPAREAELKERRNSAAAILERHCVECHGGKLTRSG